MNSQSKYVNGSAESQTLKLDHLQFDLVLMVIKLQLDISELQVKFPLGMQFPGPFETIYKPLEC